jgi:hypothetical protein
VLVCRRTGYVARMENKNKAHKYWIENPDRKILLRVPRLLLWDNIKSVCYRSSVEDVVWKRGGSWLRRVWVLLRQLVRANFLHLLTFSMSQTAIFSFFLFVHTSSLKLMAYNLPTLAANNISHIQTVISHNFFTSSAHLQILKKKKNDCIWIQLVPCR